jgi:hypothetical protein
MSLFEAIGTGQIYLAAGKIRFGVFDVGPAFDVAGGDRLACAGAKLEARSGVLTPIKR